MNANGRRCREFGNGNRGLARICGKSFAGGRRIYPATAVGNVHEAIARERAAAARIAAAKGKKKKR